MKTNAATATIFTTTFCFIFINTVMAPFASADDYPVSLDTARNIGAQDFGPLIVPDASNSAIPGLVPFDLNANLNCQMPPQALPPSTDVLPSQNLDSASTPNVGAQMPLMQQTPQAAISSPAQGFTQTNQTETQTPQEWRKSAFDSLTNNPNVQPMFGRTQSQNAGATASSNSNGVIDNSNVNNGNGAPGNNPNASSVGITAMNNPTNAGMNNQPAQSQTLTGPSSNQQQGQATKRSNGNSYNSGLTGVTRFASMFTMMGAGLMMGTMMRR
jgi:hypothetical protein